ncbi:MAG: hypothetical protein M0006_15465 [Magnetospirillum sp.]|nr:hypothetical protein [Magnetospirillum sp.]
MTAAERAVVAGRFDAALRLLARLPDDVPGRDALLGAAHLGCKHATAARDHLRRAAAQAPGDASIQMLLGRAHLLAADPGAAVRVFERLAAEAPGLPGLGDALAATYRRDARYGDVLRIAQTDSAPSDQMLYETALSQAALGDAAGSIATWDTLLARAPDLAAAWYASHAPALDLLGPAESERRLERAAACPKANGKYLAMLAAYDVLAGRQPRDFRRKHAHMVESAAALLPDLAPGWRLFGVAPELLRWAVAEARRPGLVLEFGVRRGTSLAAIAAVAGQDVHGFDSFEGLPEAWNGAPRGVLSTGCEMPAAADGIRLHRGWFEDTLPAFLAAHPAPVRFANIDCDIYSSTRTVLTALAGRIGPGTVLVFDEFIGNRSWRDDEYRAFREFAAAYAVRTRIIAVNLACKQVAMVVTE